MSRILLVIFIIMFTLLGATNPQGCNNPGMQYDIYFPVQYPNQPVMRTYAVYLDGQRLPYIFYQGSFGTGLFPNQNVQVCWSSCAIVVPRGAPNCPVYPQPWAPDPTPCLESCETYDQEPIDCFPVQWFPAIRAKRVENGGSRWSILNGQYMGWR